MNKENVKGLLDVLALPVSKIEADLGMPPGTLAKARTGERTLPEKWGKPFLDYFKEYNMFTIQKKEELLSKIPGLTTAANVTPKSEDHLKWQGFVLFCKKYGHTPETMMQWIESQPSINPQKQSEDIEGYSNTVTSIPKVKTAKKVTASPNSGESKADILKRLKGK